MKSLKTMSFLLTASAALVSCGSSSGGGGNAEVSTADLVPTLAATLTAPSGTALAGLVLEIPAGAVQDPVSISLRLGQATASSGQNIAGPAATFLPADLVFAVPAQLDLPFDVGAVGATAPASLRVQVRDDQTNQVTEVLPDSVDVSSGTVRLTVPRFSTCWVTTPDQGGSNNGSASGTLTLSGPDTGVIGTSLSFDVAGVDDNSYLFSNQTNVPAGTFAAISVGTAQNTQNLFGVALVVSVGFEAYGYVCLDIPSGPQPCDGVTVDVANQTVTFVDVTLMESGDFATAPLVLNGQVSWNTP